MLSSTPATKGPIHLQYDGGQVLVTPEDEDRFVMASNQAVSACQGLMAFRRAFDLFKSQFLMRLHDWCSKHADHVQECYVIPPIEYPKAFVVTKSPKFDFLLGDAIAELEMDFHGANWPCDILQIASGTPNELLAFFNPEQSIKVFGDGHNCTASGES